MLKTSYESMGDVPDSVKEFVVEKDGKAILQIEGVKTDADISALQSVVDKERRARRDAEAKLNGLESKYSLLPDDFNIDEYNQLKDGFTGTIDEKLKEQRERITKQYNTELEKLKGQVQEKDNLVQVHVKNATLQKAIAEAGVAKQFVPAVEAMMANKLTLEGTDVYLNEKPVSEAMKAWAQSDDGKHYVVAATNSGGGTNTTKANGANNMNVQTMNRSEYMALPSDKKVELAKSGVKLSDE